MAKYVIRQGSHRALPFSLGVYIDKKVMTRNVTFHPDCRYDLGNENQQDWNKLFGLGYLWSLHTDSARFAWRYNKEKDCIEIAAYAYVDGERIMEYICNIQIGHTYTLSLDVTESRYTFTVNWGIVTMGQEEVLKNRSKIISYKLGLYFGGNEVAPHEMHVTIDRVATLEGL